MKATLVVGREEAILCAQSHVWAVQDDPYVELPVALVDHILERGWYDALFPITLAECLAARAQGKDVGPYVDRMVEVAELSGDGALVARSYAYLIEFRQDDDDMDFLQQRLGRAVAILDSGQGRSIFRTSAYLGCGLGYRHSHLWSLCDEMLIKSIDVSYESTLECHVKTMKNARATARLNRVLCAKSMAVDAYQLDNRDRCWEIYRSIDLEEQLPAEGTMPRIQALGLASVNLIAALAGEGPPRGADQAIGLALDHGRNEASAITLVAEAVRLLDRGRSTNAALAATKALDLIEADDQRRGQKAVWSHHTLALHVAALGEPVSEAAMAYAQQVVAYELADRDERLRAAISQRHTEAVRIESDRLASLAFTDPLTGLGNRRGYEQFCQKLLDEPDIDAIVLVVDINYFKAINDRFGHAVGDSVLVDVAAILASATRRSDLVVRTGGDEFLVVLPGATEQVARQRVVAIEAKIMGHDWGSTHDGLTTVSASIGWAAGTSHHVDDLIKQADKAMYRIKREKR